MILTGHANRVSVVVFSPDGRRLASVDEEGEIRLWDVGTGQTFAILAIGTQGSPALAFSPDGTLLAIGTEAGTVQLWDVATERTSGTLTGHTQSVRGPRFFHPTAPRLPLEAETGPSVSGTLPQNRRLPHLRNIKAVSIRSHFLPMVRHW